VAGNILRQNAQPMRANRSGGKYPTFYWQIKAIAKKRRSRAYRLRLLQLMKAVVWA
jgi:hypothetical protein